MKCGFYQWFQIMRLRAALSGVQTHDSGVAAVNARGRSLEIFVDFGTAGAMPAFAIAASARLAARHEAWQGKETIIKTRLILFLSSPPP
jgi:hypothetical protein